MRTLAMIGAAGSIYLLPFWPFAFFGMWAFWNALRENRDAKSIERSLGWPETQVRVVGGSVVWGHVEIKYEYNVSGRRREGTYTKGFRHKRPERTPPAGQHSGFQKPRTGTWRNIHLDRTS